MGDELERLLKELLEEIRGLKESLNDIRELSWTLRDLVEELRRSRPSIISPQLISEAIKESLESSLKAIEDGIRSSFSVVVVNKRPKKKVVIYPFRSEKQVDIEEIFDKLEEKLDAEETEKEFEAFDPSEVAQALEVLSNPDRLRILKLLAKRARYFGELEELLGIGPSSLRHHLSKLLSAGLIKQERSRGKYYITERGLSALRIVAELRKKIFEEGGEEE